MDTALCVEKMIEFCDGNVHDVCHFLKVYAYARTIGELENLDAATREITQVAAIVHDIACPLCRKKYGRADGDLQEIEGGPLAREFLSALDCPQALVDRVCYLVSHHHTYTNVDGLDYRILLEADFLVNADEANMSREAIRAGLKNIFRTRTGARLLKSIYKLDA